MKVKILVEFEVEGLADEAENGELTEGIAKSAASCAVWGYLSFVEISGYSSDTETVNVHVDGYGDCRVRIGEDHE